MSEDKTQPPPPPRPEEDDGDRTLLVPMPGRPGAPVPEGAAPEARAAAAFLGATGASGHRGAARGWGEAREARLLVIWA